MLQDEIKGNKGTYIIILHLSQEKKIEVGHLGNFRFAKGFYAYVGSAFGNGGLDKRISHHISASKNPHWHIDYLRNHAEPVEFWFTKSLTKLEHTWATLMTHMPGGNFFLSGFGSSDCSCVSHLYYFGSKPQFQSFKNLLHNNMKNSLEVNRILIQ